MDFNKLNKEGIPLPMLRDPKTGEGSVTLTMFWTSFNISIFTLAGKMTNLLGDVDYNNVMWLFVITGSLYLGRKFQGDKSSININE